MSCQSMTCTGKPAFRISLCCAGPILGFPEPRRGSLDVFVKFGDFLLSNSVWFLSSISFLQLTAALMNAMVLCIRAGLTFDIQSLQRCCCNDITTTKLQRYRGWSGPAVMSSAVVHSQYSSLTSQFKLAEEATWLNWQWDVIDFPTRGET